MIKNQFAVSPASGPIVVTERVAISGPGSSETVSNKDMRSVRAGYQESRKDRTPFATE